MEPGAREAGERFMVFPGCAETVSAASSHRSGVGRKIFVRNFGSEFTGIPNTLSLRILWRGRRLARIGILLGFVSLQRFLRVLCLFVLELLECGHGLLRVFRAMKVTVDDAELIPGLLDDFGIGAGRGSGALQTLSGSGVIAKQHFGAPKIVVGMKKSGLCPQGGFDEFLALCPVAFFNRDHA